MDPKERFYRQYQGESTSKSTLPLLTIKYR